MFCPNCGNKINGGGRYCPKCGKALANRPDNHPNQERVLPGRDQARPRPEKDHSKQFTLIGIGVLIVILCAMTIGMFLQKQHDKERENREALRKQTQTEGKFKPQALQEKTPDRSSQTQGQTEEKIESEPHISSHALTGSFSTAKASSHLPDKGDLTYGPENVMDGKPETAWNEGVSGHGAGEWLMLESDHDQVVTGINILAGYAKNADIYQQNNRIKTLKVECADGTSKVFRLEDRSDYASYHDLAFDKPVRTKSIKFTVIDIYPGSKYEDTCISEITLY